RVLQTRPGLSQTCRGFLQTSAGLLKTLPDLLKPLRVRARTGQGCRNLCRFSPTLETPSKAPLACAWAASWAPMIVTKDVSVYLPIRRIVMNKVLQKPSAAFVGASWAVLLIGAVAYLIGLWNANMQLNEKGYYFTILMYGLFAAVSLQKSVRDRLEGIP